MYGEREKARQTDLQTVQTDSTYFVYLHFHFDITTCAQRHACIRVLQHYLVRTNSMMHACLRINTYVRTCIDDSWKRKKALVPRISAAAFITYAVSHTILVLAYLSVPTIWKAEFLSSLLIQLIRIVSVNYLHVKCGSKYIRPV